MILTSRLGLLFASCGTLVMIHACSTVSDQIGWIKVGQTTRQEVVARYGQPDLVMASEEGEVAIYRRGDPSGSAPRVEIPTVQAGPLGTATTKMETIEPGETQVKRPSRDLRIRYDAQGIVREILP